jgi:DNA replication licensing factor MCM4
MLLYITGESELIMSCSLRKMRTSKQTNLNLDLQDLEAFPPTKKLARWIRTYPQEVVPMCDQVLKE